MPKENEAHTVYRGRHLSMCERGRWEYVTRNTRRPAVGIVAITDENEIVVVEQFRPPVEQSVVELPAGLVGDIAGAEHEALVEAAQRELFEETGYTAQKWTELGCGFSSPGLTDESIVFFLATKLAKTGPGGGDASENIAIHEIAMHEITKWIKSFEGRIDMKLIAGLFLAQQTLFRLEGP